ncbi:MAG: SRPBCC family protein [Acidobacteriota bacterium]|nr:SRPBCC family protein [Acidobacteriota bacterium]
MIVKILIALVLAVGVFCLVAVMQPATYHVERSTTIAAPPDRVYALVNDFHNWDDWSPWAKLDPAMTHSVSGPAAGTGSTYTWSGNDKAGAGTMIIRDSQPDSHVGIHLAFTKPYASSSDVAFSIKPQGPGTAVVWSMDGENGFMLKAMSLFTSMDKMIGPDFEKGLGQLKTLSEKR